MAPIALRKALTLAWILRCPDLRNGVVPRSAVRTFRSDSFLVGVEIESQDIFREQFDFFYSCDLSCNAIILLEEVMLTLKCA